MPPDCVRDASRGSDSSLGSENPYATIKDLPVLLAKAPEGSYMEMKSPACRETSYTEIGCSEPAPDTPQPHGTVRPPPAHGQARWSRALTPVSPLAGPGPGSAEGAAVPPGHYDSPKNSHIPSHYDVPPVRHYPPSPPLRRQHR